MGSAESSLSNVVVSGKYAYITTNPQGRFYIVDISDPKNPTVLEFSRNC